MSSKHGIVPVKMVYIQAPDRQQPIRHSNEVTVRLLEERESDIVYLRIAVNQQIILSETLDHFRWIHESCMDGVATIDSASLKIIIIYDSKDKQSRDVFAQMKALLNKGPSSEPPGPSLPRHTPVREDQTEVATNDLIKLIETGISVDAERAAQYLAQSHANIRFNLSNDSNDKNKTVVKPTDNRASSNVLRLQLIIECHLNKDPIIATIDVRSGTNLRSLKDQTESQTGVNYKHQYWYAFDRYMIADEYEFGSSQSVVPPLPKNAPRKQAIPPSDPIRSGDTLILYIAQMRPYK